MGKHGRQTSLEQSQGILCRATYHVAVPSDTVVVHLTIV
jgi:hypothetical protein